MGKYVEVKVLTQEHIDSVDPVFKPVIASAIMQELMKRIEEDKKDVEALQGAIDLFGTDTVLPAFSGAKRKDWNKQLTKAKNKAEGKEPEKKKKKKKDGDKKKKERTIN